MKFERSLHLRLLAFAGAAVAIALAVAWAGLGLLFERHLERQLQTELERHGLALIAAVELDAEGRPVLTAAPFDPRFERPASGLYWHVRAQGGELRSRSLWDGDLAVPADAPAHGWGAVVATGPFEDRVLTVFRDVQLRPGTSRVRVEAAADLRPLAEAKAAFGRESAAFLAVLWVALALAALVQVRLGLAPLEGVRADLQRMRDDPSVRLDAARHPREVRPLTEAINGFAQARAEDVDRARRRAQDLAHALKTPLTVLRLQIEGLEPGVAREMTHSLSLVSGAVEGELARAGGPVGAQAGADARTTVERLLAVVRRTPAGRRLALDNGIAAGVTLPLGRDAALEALGAVLENGARHARSRVWITGLQDAAGVTLTLSDDGPGIRPEYRDHALTRGARLDETEARHGLGLAIARDFVEACGGVLTLEDADGGGLKVVMHWSAAAAGDRSAKSPGDTAPVRP
jgi:signal transduction histidine kinase